MKSERQVDQQWVEETRRKNLRNSQKNPPLDSLLPASRAPARRPLTDDEKALRNLICLALGVLLVTVFAFVLEAFSSK